MVRFLKFGATVAKCCWQIETIPTRSEDGQSLQNVLSVSTAGKNRYLFHFNSLHSLTQWTAGIRLSMFEHATLQEAYTGSLIAGKGKALNNIRVIMERTKLKTEDWARVRFGAGTPWRRCWCVITPPDEKEVQKLQKSLKKKSAYDRVIPTLKGNVKFYDTKRTKKVKPIATINDAYSAYAIYPQSKPLIDQSTLVKVEGNITIHSTPETTTEGFVFVMPETHPAVSGFEMMLRWLFPLYDIFALYGRPNRLIADTRNTQSLMFALPQERRYGYLEILDVASLIHESGSQDWNEKEWRSRLKELSLARITRLEATGSRQRSRASSYRGHRNSFPSRTGTLRYDDSASIRSSPSFHNDIGLPSSPQKPGSAPPGESPFPLPGPTKSGHHRSVSDVLSLSTPRHRPSQRSNLDYTPSKLTHETPQSITPSESPPPVPPAHDAYGVTGIRNHQGYRNVADADGVYDRSSSESETRLRGQVDHITQDVRQELHSTAPMVPVITPPAFSHEAGAKPARRPHVSPELRRANSRMSISTLNQLAAAGQLSSERTFTPSASPATPNASEVQGDRSFLENPSPTMKSNGTMRGGDFVEDYGPRGVNDEASKLGTTADHLSLSKGKESVGAGRSDAQSGQIPDHLDRRNRGSTADYQQQPLVSVSPMPLSRNARSLSQNFSHPDTSPLAQQEQYSRNNPQIIPNHELSGRYSQHSPVSEDRALPRPPIRRDTETNRVSATYSIPRKPVPNLPQPQMSEPASPVSRSSLESLRQHVVDEHALDQLYPQRAEQPYRIDSYYEQHSSDGESIHDNDSNVSPDYASTRKSTETKRSKASVERPRMGKLKTVGTVEPVPDEATVQIRAALPEVDFGPTQVYSQGIGKRPPRTGSTHEGFDPTHRLTPSPRSHSPGVPQSAGGDKRVPHERSPSRSLGTPEPGRRTPSNASIHDSPRNVVWQPGATIGGGSPSGRQVITPEQFVQQRAAANRVTPVYAHGRKQSEQRTPPTASRNPSGEWPLQQHGRQASFTKEIPTRPHSRGASTIIMNSSADLPGPLSAREQEHVARVTGSPLIHMAGNPGRHAPHGGGLIGAIEAREKEKRDIKEGLSGHLVQQAIAQRQQYNQNYLNNQQQPFPSPSPQMHMPGQWPQTPSIIQQQYVGTPQQQLGQLPPQKFMSSPPQQRQQWISPATQQYWNAPQTAPSPYLQHNLRQGQQGFPQHSGASYQQPGTYQQQGSHQQQGPYHQQQGSYQQQQGSYSQQGQYNQSQQQQPYGSYFGSGQGGR